MRSWGLVDFPAFGHNLNAVVFGLVPCWPMVPGVKSSLPAPSETGQWAAGGVGGQVYAGARLGACREQLSCSPSAFRCRHHLLAASSPLFSACLLPSAGPAAHQPTSHLLCLPGGGGGGCVAPSAHEKMPHYGIDSWLPSPVEFTRPHLGCGFSPPTLSPPPPSKPTWSHFCLLSGWHVKPHVREEATVASEAETKDLAASLPATY